ncbi:hypothetical protein NXY56_002022 [Leishmania guyanensis]
MRLQRQLQDLLQLPRNEVQEMRQRMQDPDIAIPLLQCYDAVIREKTEEVERLRRETVGLQTQLDAFHRDQLDVSNAVRMAEELAKNVQDKAAAEVQRYLEAVREMQGELVRLRLEMTRALEAENTAKQDALRTAERAASLETALEAAKRATSKAEAAREAAERKVRVQEQHAAEEQTDSVVQKTQLEVMTQENAAKAQELERLRAKMMQALRQASDNHAAHLRVVEERHHTIVENLRSVNRTQEMEMLKLRAQLARWDPTNPSGACRGAGASSPPTSLRFQSTTELLEAQARQAQELELKRLYGEVSTLQLQRNDAVRQYEQRTARLQRDCDQQLQDVQRQLQSAQRSLAEVRSRCEELEETKATQEASLRKARDELRQAQQDGQQYRLSADSHARKLASAQQQLAEANERLSALQREKQSAVRQAQERASELESNVAQVLQEVQSAKERAYVEVGEVQRRYEELRMQNSKLQDGLREREAALAKKERERNILEVQLGRLEEGLEAHKRRIVEADRRVQQLEQQLTETRQQHRGSFLSLEQMKLQNVQLTRTRDQLTEMLQGRLF